ncbi:hypothetical protein LJR231_001596 [Phyllobacterium sp. LjRoot231]|uniref:hypothetical protein n=1 Tax=Phyllobacterium sp. LjRoot231 TaxID=3342289 RepID=UPI003ECD876D
MADSFFTTRNLYDQQVLNMDAMHCEHLLDAVSRRMALLNGPMGASVKTQRIADILAVAYVLPVEHWKASDVTVPESLQPAHRAKPAQRTIRAAVWASIGDTGIFCAVIGFWLGVTAAGIANTWF